MNDTETIADIVRDMRMDATASVESGVATDDADERDVGEQLRDYADRINAAAERDQVSGNAAELRAALEHVRDAVRYAIAARAFPERLNAEISAALSAPVRNCDRFATLAEAVLASGEASAEAPGILGMGNAQLVRFCKWLFAPAEGGSLA